MSSVTKSCLKIFPNKYYKKLDRKIKLTEKESIKNQLWFKSYKGNKSRGLSVMNRKLPRGLSAKRRKRFGVKTLASGGSVLLQRRNQKTVRFKRTERLTGGPRLSDLKEREGGKRSSTPESFRRSPATIHGEIGEKEGTAVLGRSFRVGWWWTRSTGGTTATGSSSPADGGVGLLRISPERAPMVKLKWGLDEAVDLKGFGKV